MSLLKAQSALRENYSARTEVENLVSFPLVPLKEGILRFGIIRGSRDQLGILDCNPTDNRGDHYNI